MPNYTYVCYCCSEFTIKQSINDKHDVVTCPTCGKLAKRVFNSFNTYGMDPKLKKRIEKGQQPKIVSKENINKTNIPKAKRSARPWMMGH